MGGDDAAVADGLAGAPFASGAGDFAFDVFVAGDGAFGDEVGGDEDLDAVADGEDPFAGGGHGANEGDEAVVVAEVFRSPASD